VQDALLACLVKLLLLAPNAKLVSIRQVGILILAKGVQLAGIQATKRQMRNAKFVVQDLLAVRLAPKLLIFLFVRIVPREPFLLQLLRPRMLHARNAKKESTITKKVPDIHLFANFVCQVNLEN
jgi:hypothetical protein